jgi:purine-binding chemotaxis protein CheW
MQTDVEEKTAAGAAAKTTERAGKYLTFHLGQEEFAIQVLKVREIKGMQEITAIPHTPLFVKGVINLRGKVIHVVDLRLKFGLPEAEHTQLTCIIVVQIRGEVEPLLMGILVDAVSEVVSLTKADIEDTPDFGQGVSIPNLLGIAKTKGGVKILLNIDEILTSQEVHGIETVLQPEC